jgi:hypothetical protein
MFGIVKRSTRWISDAASGLVRVEPDVASTSLRLGIEREPVAESDTEYVPEATHGSGPIVLGLSSAVLGAMAPSAAFTPAQPASQPVSPSIAEATLATAPAEALSSPAPIARISAAPLPGPPAPFVSASPSVPASPSKTPDPIVVPPEEPAKSVFISYRRQDSQHITGRIYDRLLTTFSRESVFKDVDSIPLGLDFREHLREQVGHCSVLVAVIGRNWNPTTASGQRRMSDPRDHLRIEIESALDRHIPVIPVLVDGVEMPAEDELPTSLSSLAYHNGISVRPDPDFHHDADRLVRGIEQLLK